jgi:hypothetical protein
MKRFLLYQAFFLLLVSFTCSTVYAVSPNKSSSKNTSKSVAEELASLLLSYGQMNQLSEEMAESAMQEFRPEAEKKIDRELTRSEDEQFKVIFKKVFSEVYPKKFWMEVIASVYSDFFTNEEIRSLINFYQTQAGKKFLYLNPSLTKELEVVSLKLSEKKQQILTDRLGEELIKIPTIKALFENGSTDSEKKLADFGQALEKCKQIQDSKEILIGCEMSLAEKDKTPVLLITLPNSQHFEKYWERLSEHIGVPFCIATNDSSLEAVVIAYVTEDEKARVFNCTTGGWSDWFDYKASQKTF